MYDEQFLQETLLRVFENEEYYNLPRGIKRFDYGTTHGWWVRVSRDRAMFRKLFCDKESGSIQEALKNAILYRHEILASFPVTIKQLNHRSLPLEPEKRISLVKEHGKKQPYIAWRARWYTKDCKIERAAFSVQKYGNDEARALALNAATVNHYKKLKLSKTPDLYQTQEFKPLSRADVEVLATINSSKRASKAPSIKDILNHNPFAYEGGRKLELHKSIERNRNLRNHKITSFLELRGKLYCELCNFNFLETYPFLTVDIIEVHHIIPLASLSSGATTNLNDLMLLCSNCHFAVHQGDPEINLIVAQDHFASLSKGAEKQIESCHIPCTAINEDGNSNMRVHSDAPKGGARPASLIRGGQ
jgi:predicted HNH restriction endonuclease